MQPIFKLMTSVSAECTLHQQGRTLLTSHIKYLRNSKQSVVHLVNPELAFRFKYSLFAYLRSISVDVKIHWAIMVLNDLKSPEAFDGTVTRLVIPSINEVNTILTVADM